MSSQALVLGGGGSIGIAWECGVLKGLADSGVALSNADLIIGTSAGSVVGSQLAFGRTPDQLLASQLVESDGLLERATVFDVQVFTSIATRWASATQLDAEERAAIGAMALAAPTADEAAWVQVFEATLGGLPWPERRLMVTGVAAESGAFVAWEQSSGVPIARAVAASCTVPGLFPPVTIDGTRYIDGGVRSGTNADLARDHQTVVIIAPIGATDDGLGPIARRYLLAEMEALRAAGSTVFLLQPDTASLTAFGPNLMDGTRRALAAQAGVVQGQTVAEQLRAIWSS